MKNTRRVRVCDMERRVFRARPGSGARRTFSVLPKRRLSEGGAAVRQGRSNCGTGCGQRENGRIQRNK